MPTLKALVLLGTVYGIGVTGWDRAAPEELHRPNPNESSHEHSHPAICSLEACSFHPGVGAHEPQAGNQSLLAYGFISQKDAVRWHLSSTQVGIDDACACSKIALLPVDSIYGVPCVYVV